MPQLPVHETTCRTCGRRIHREGRKAAQAPSYCSAACRRRKPNREDAVLEEAILTLLARRATSSTICPSEAARAVRPDDWRPLMERARRAARRLVAADRVRILQGGRVADPSTAKGPIRVGRGPAFHAPSGHDEDAG